jgi:hypothetical protein
VVSPIFLFGYETWLVARTDAIEVQVDKMKSSEEN